MSDNTGIEWADATWPIVAGCTHISEGCENCYAAKLTSGRLRHLPEYSGLAEHGRFNGTVRCLTDRLDWPLHWRKPRKIFVSDMADLFHEAVPDEFIVAVFGIMAQTPQHTYQVLTKRHGRMRSLLNSDKFCLTGMAAALSKGLDVEAAPWPLPNVWLGVSAEDQHWADIRIPALLRTPAAVRFVSAEPLLGRIDLSLGRSGYWRSLSWVIAGGESGPGARPCELEWLRSLRDQCVDAGVPVFIKQLGAVLGRELSAGSKGNHWDAFPEDLRIREFPATEAAAA